MCNLLAPFNSITYYFSHYPSTFGTTANVQNVHAFLKQLLYFFCLFSSYIYSYTAYIAIQAHPVY